MGRENNRYATATKELELQKMDCDQRNIRTADLIHMNGPQQSTTVHVTAQTKHERQGNMMSVYYHKNEHLGKPKTGSV